MKVPALLLLASLDPDAFRGSLLAVTPGWYDQDLCHPSIWLLFGLKTPVGWSQLGLWGWFYLVVVVLLWTRSSCLIY